MARADVILGTLIRKDIADKLMLEIHVEPYRISTYADDPKAMTKRVDLQIQSFKASTDPLIHRSMIHRLIHGSSCAKISEYVKSCAKKAAP